MRVYYGWMAAMMAIVVVTFGYEWSLLLWQPPLLVTGWPGWQRSWPAALLPLFCGALTLAAVFPFWLRRMFRDEETRLDTPELPPALSWALVTVSWGLVVLLCAAVARNAIDPVRAALVLVCGAATLLALGFALAALWRGTNVALSSHWGGLGGGLGGWQISSSAAALFIALVFLGATLAVGSRNGQETNESNAVTANVTNAASGSGTMGNQGATNEIVPSNNSSPTNAVQQNSVTNAQAASPGANAVGGAH